MVGWMFGLELVYQYRVLETGKSRVVRSRLDQCIKPVIALAIAIMISSIELYLMKLIWGVHFLGTFVCNQTAWLDLRDGMIVDACVNCQICCR